jgi:hypothetical protein
MAWFSFLQPSYRHMSVLHGRWRWLLTDADLSVLLHSQKTFTKAHNILQTIISFYIWVLSRWVWVQGTKWFLLLYRCLVSGPGLWISKLLSGGGGQAAVLLWAI